MALDYKDELEFALGLAKGVGEIQLKLYNSVGKSKARKKENGPPQYAADRRSSEYLLGRISKESSDYGVLSEEDPTNRSRFEKEHWWLIDELDNSVGFNWHGWDWGPKIALMKGSRPVLGVVYRPMFKQTPQSSGKPEYLFGAEGVDVQRRFDGSDKPFSVSNNFRNFRAEVSTRGNDNLDQMLGLLGYERTRRQRKKLKQRLEGEVPRKKGMKMMKVAKGEIDLAIYSPGMNIGLWDCAADEYLVISGGGNVTDAQGNITNFLQEDTIFKKGHVSSNGIFDHNIFKREIPWIFE